MIEATIERLMGWVKDLLRRVERLEAAETPKRFVPLTTPLTSTAWEGDSFSTSTSWATIDLSAIFGVPAGIKAVLMAVSCRDSGSAGATWNYIMLGPTGFGGVLRMPAVLCSGLPNDIWTAGMLTVPCNTSGDIMYYITASGVGTFDAYLTIWGYWI